jgi:hypothetical protein
MPILSLHQTGAFMHFAEDECVAAGADLHRSYVAASPFPHIVLDDFLDAGILRDVEQHYPSRVGRSYFDREQERLKYQYAAGEIGHGPTRNLLAELNGEAFLRFLSALTGIKGLIPDPYHSGGGLHETLSGGHLSIHADFNKHGLMRVQRRINLLIYLNDDWLPEYGGALELWDQGMTRAEHRVLPLMGRAVIFNTDLDSFHGQPDALSCPPDRTRRSIATYYYTAFEGDPSVERDTNFRPRPHSDEKPDYAIRYKHFVNDWVPARLQRLAHRCNLWRR